jgi:NAD+ diphosphatase
MAHGYKTSKGAVQNCTALKCELCMTFKAVSGKDRNRLWFIFNKGKLLVERARQDYQLPSEGDVTRSACAPERTFYFGALDGRPCYAGCLAPNFVLPDQFEWIDLRALFGSMQEELLWVAGRANQLLDWDLSHRFCGRCGAPTEDKTDERAKSCPGCGLLNYPRLSPAVIAAVLKGDHILLARGKNFRVPMFSVLAGFVEPGETLEACVQREIREEVGIEVTNIHFHK